MLDHPLANSGGQKIHGGQKYRRPEAISMQITATRVGLFRLGEASPRALSKFYTIRIQIIFNVTNKSAIRPSDRCEVKRDTLVYGIR